MGHLKASKLLLVLLMMHIVKNVLVRTRTHVTVPHSIPTYWINLDKSVDRRVHMYQHLQGHEHVRIRAVDAYEARKRCLLVKYHTWVSPFNYEQQNSYI